MSEAMQDEYRKLTLEAGCTKSLVESKIAEFANYSTMGNQSAAELARLTAHELLDNYFDKYTRMSELFHKLNNLATGNHGTG